MDVVFVYKLVYQRFFAIQGVDVPAAYIHDKVQTGYPGARGRPGSTGSDTTLSFSTGARATRAPAGLRVPGRPRVPVNNYGQFAEI